MTASFVLQVCSEVHDNPSKTFSTVAENLTFRQIFTKYFYNFFFCVTKKLSYIFVVERRFFLIPDNVTTQVTKFKHSGKCQYSINQNGHR